MKIVVFGTGPFAVPTFNHLLESDHEIVGVVTRPIIDSGKRRKTAENPVRDLAESKQLPVFDPTSIKTPESVERLGQFSADLFFVCDYGQILSRNGLAQARLGGINLHGSLLPKYRGAAPIHWAIYNGETEAGVTVIHMTAKLDAGPCLTHAKTEVGPDETTETLEPRLAQIGVSAVMDAIEMLEQWDGESPIGSIQDPNQATKAPRIQKADGLIDWSQSAEQIKNQIRAFQPWPGSFCEWKARKKPLRLIVHKVNVVDGQPETQPGTIIESSKDRFVIQTGNQGLQILEIQPSGKRVMQVEEFLRGYQPKVGEMFG